MKTVFVVQHSYERDEEDEVKFIGVFSTEAAARFAIGELVLQSGFSEHPDDFYIDEYELDKAAWSEGFVTERSPDSQGNFRSRTGSSPPMTSSAAGEGKDDAKVSNEGQDNGDADK